MISRRIRLTICTAVIAADKLVATIKSESTTRSPALLDSASDQTVRIVIPTNNPAMAIELLPPVISLNKASAPSPCCNFPPNVASLYRKSSAIYWTRPHTSRKILSIMTLVKEVANQEPRACWV